MDKQVRAFHEFFNWLVQKGYIKEVATAEIFIEMDVWLKVQKKNAAEDLRLVQASVEAKTELVNAFLAVAAAKELF